MKFTLELIKYKLYYNYNTKRFAKINCLVFNGLILKEFARVL